MENSPSLLPFQIPEKSSAFPENIHRDDPTRFLTARLKCQLSVCNCRSETGNQYCSDYCEQAASQGIEKEFCQCAHGNCSRSAVKSNAQDAVGLPDSICFAPGRVTIEFDSMQHLTDQLMLLANAVSDDNGAREAGVDLSLRRRSAVSEGFPAAASAKSA